MPQGHTKGRLTPMRRIALRTHRKFIRTCSVARHVAANVSCFKMDRVVSLALLCEESENEEYEVRNKRKRFSITLDYPTIVTI